MITPIDIENKLREEKPFLENYFSVETIGYFGSFATNSYKNDSDIDILVKLKKGIGWRFFELKDYLESKLGRKVDLVTENSVRPVWKEDILHQVKYV